MVGTKTFRADAARRVLALLAAVLVLMLPVALPWANAEPDYPPAFYKISADTFTARVGQSIHFTAQKFQAGSPVEFSVTAAGSTVQSGSVTANSNGIASRTITFTVEGANTVTASGTSDKGDALSLPATITVTSATSGNGGSDNGSGGSNGGSGGTGGDNATNTGSDSGSAPQADDASGVPFFGGGLPRTGGDIALTALIGLALLGGGAALVFATRNRRTN